MLRISMEGTRSIQAQPHSNTSTTFDMTGIGPQCPEQEFVLPPGCETCPIIECAKFGLTLDPHWRLTEHMKRSHGWPRKKTQRKDDQYPSNSIARHSNTMTGKEQLIWVSRSVPNISDNALADSLNQRTSSTAHDEGPRAQAQRRTTRKSIPTPRHRESLVGQPLFDDEHYRDTMSDEPDITREEIPNSQSSQRDDAMIAEIQKYISELKTYSDNKGFAAGLQGILDKDMIYVNKILPATQSHAISPLYKALADRAERHHATFNMNATAQRAQHYPDVFSRTDCGLPETKGFSNLLVPKIKHASIAPASNTGVVVSTIQRPVIPTEAFKTPSPATKIASSISRTACGQSPLKKLKLNCSSPRT